jgi:hypothetical protein
LVGQRRKAGHAGVDEDGVQTDAGLAQFGRQRSGGAGGAGVVAQRQRMRTQAGAHLLEHRGVAPGDDDAGALGGESLGGGQADAAGAARDQDGLLFETVHGGLLGSRGVSCAFAAGGFAAIHDRSIRGPAGDSL